MGNWWFGFLASPFHERDCYEKKRARIPKPPAPSYQFAIRCVLNLTFEGNPIWWAASNGNPPGVLIESWMDASFSGDVGSSMACSCSFCGWRSVGRWDWRRLFMAHPSKKVGLLVCRKWCEKKIRPKLAKGTWILRGKSLRTAVLKSHKFPSQPFCWKYMLYFLFLEKHHHSFPENSVAQRPVWRFDTIHPYASTLSDLVWEVALSTVVETACSVWQIWEKSSWHTISGETWQIFFFTRNFREVVGSFPGGSARKRWSNLRSEFFWNGWRKNHHLILAHNFAGLEFSYDRLCSQLCLGKRKTKKKTTFLKTTIDAANIWVF